MKELPKINDFNTPDGYFEQLPDQIMDSIKPIQKTIWIRYAASIALIISAGIWYVFAPETEVEKLGFEEEVNLYIDSQYWSAEDVLSMADNPDEILDQILNEELPEDTELWGDDNQTWF